MTNGGLGIALFSPFDDRRVFLPFNPILPSPIGIRAFFSPWGVDVLITEFVWVIFPLGTVLATSELLRGKARPA